MANEATKVELYGHNSAGDVMPFTVASGTAIAKGTCLVLSASPRTAIAHSSVEEKFLGVANIQKDSDDTSTQLGAWTNGVFDFAASGSISDGDICVLSETANHVMASNAMTDPTKIVGIAFNDATAGRVIVRVLK